MGSLTVPINTTRPKPRLRGLIRKPSKKWLIVAGLILLLVVIIIGFSRSNWTTQGDKNVPFWVLFLACAFFLWLAVYLIWKLKNTIVGWILSGLYGLLIMALLVGGKLPADFSVLLKSLITVGGATVVSIIVKMVLAPAFSIMKKSHLLEA
jgi:hypothetical protein